MSDPLCICIGNWRAIINESLTKKGITRKISWLFTLVFGMFYLQYEINRIIEDREHEKRVGPWITFILFLILVILPPILSIIWIIVVQQTIQEAEQISLSALP